MQGARFYPGGAARVYTLCLHFSGGRHARTSPTHKMDVFFNFVVVVCRRLSS